MNNANTKNINLFSGNLNDKEILDLTKILVANVTDGYQAGPSFTLLNQLESVMNNINLTSSTKQTINQLLLKLRFSAFPNLTFNQQINLLQNYSVKAFENDIDVENRLHYVFYPFLQGLEDLKRLELFKRALLTNVEKIGKNTVREWLGTFLNNFRNQSSEKLSIVQYITSDKNVNLLSPNQKELLKKILNLYFWLNRILPEKINQTMQAKGDRNKNQPIQKQENFNSNPNNFRQNQSVKLESSVLDKTKEIAIPPTITTSKAVLPKQEKPKTFVPPTPAVFREIPRTKFTTSSVLEDALMRAKIRVEAGLDIPTEQAEDIVELIKEKK